MEGSSDFEGIDRWKKLHPFLYTVNIILMILSPFYFPAPYHFICLICLAYFTLKGFCGVFTILHAFKKLQEIILLHSNQQNSECLEKRNEALRIPHAIILPNYKEDAELLNETLEKLSFHPKAKQTFYVVLAMEAHEIGSEKKAYKLIDQNKALFKRIGFTRHQVRQGEGKTKGSNVSWAIEHLLTTFEQLKEQKETLMVTVIDADSWVPKEYFMEIEHKLKQRPDLLGNTVFCPPQIFGRNHMEIPLFTRIYDNTHSLVHLSNLVSFYFAVPLSNYSYSYSLFESIGFLDINTDAITDDVHTYQKLFWKIKGPINTIPIYTPFNQLSVETGKGYIDDLKAKFWQIERHGKGINEISYALNMLFKTPLRLRNIILIPTLCEAFIGVVMFPLCIISIAIYYNTTMDQPDSLLSRQLINGLIFMMNLMGSISYFLWYVYINKANELLYRNQESKHRESACQQPLWKSVEFPLFGFSILFLMIIPGFTLAAFRVILSDNEYIVAEKKCSGLLSKED